MADSWMQRVFAAALITLFTLSGAGVVLATGNKPGAVYALTNSAAGNEVAVFTRAPDGTLIAAGTLPTGGLGTGAGLGSQGALALSPDNKWLLAVNPGSNDLSVFAVSAEGLTLVDTVAAGGIRPVSVTIHKDLVYVLNAGGSGNIAGFTMDKTGNLSPIANSVRPLSNNGVGAAPAPAQVSFSPDGDVLAVTERATSLIDTYAIDGEGVAGDVTPHPSAGTTPCGFAFGKHSTLIVSEAAGGVGNASSASSYHVSDDGLVLVSGAVSNTQTAACWAVTTKNGKYAYTANAGSGSISAFAVGRGGDLTLLDGVAGSTGPGSHPTDIALSHDSQFLYALVDTTGTIGAFAVQADGSLIAVSGGSGLPASAAGLAAW